MVHIDTYKKLRQDIFDFKATTTYHVYLKAVKLEKMFPGVADSFEGRICVQFEHKFGHNKVKLVYPKTLQIPNKFTPRHFMLRVI